MMSIEVEDDVYWKLRWTESVQHRSLSEILRGLVSPGTTDGPAPVPQGSGTVVATPAVQPGSDPTSRDRALLEYIVSADFRHHRQDVDRFLGILSHLHERHPDTFSKLLDLSGRKRKYLGSSESELSQAGTSVNAKPIPRSNFWVVTNNSTRDKGKLLREILTLLGYSESTIREVTMLFGM